MSRNVSLIVLGAVALAGCGHTPALVYPYLNDAARDQGLVVVLPGVEGRMPSTRPSVRAWSMGA